MDCSSFLYNSTPKYARSHASELGRRFVATFSRRIIDLRRPPNGPKRTCDECRWWSKGCVQTPSDKISSPPAGSIDKLYPGSSMRSRTLSKYPRPVVSVKITDKDLTSSPISPDHPVRLPFSLACSDMVPLLGNAIPDWTCNVCRITSMMGSISSVCAQARKAINHQFQCTWCWVFLLHSRRS